MNGKSYDFYLSRGVGLDASVEPRRSQKHADSFLFHGVSVDAALERCVLQQMGP